MTEGVYAPISYQLVRKNAETVFCMQEMLLLLEIKTERRQHNGWPGCLVLLHRKNDTQLVKPHNL